jgi:hypothetical protein
MVRDEVKRLRESDRVTGLRSEIEEAMSKQDMGEAERLSKNLYDEVVERSCRPRPLNRLLALSQEGSIVTIDPDGSNLGLVAFGNSDLVRHSQPTWSPSGDFVVASEYSGTVLNSPIDSTNHVVVLQVRFPHSSLYSLGGGIPISCPSPHLRLKVAYPTPKPVLSTLAQPITSLLGALADPAPLATRVLALLLIPRP